MREISLDHEDGAGRSLRLRVLDLESRDEISGNCPELDSAESVERTVGHVIDHINNVIVFHKFTDDVRADKTAATSY
jgi:hypothetical protein